MWNTVDGDTSTQGICKIRVCCDRYCYEPGRFYASYVLDLFTYDNCITNNKQNGYWHMLHFLKHPEKSRMV